MKKNTLKAVIYACILIFLSSMGIMNLQNMQDIDENNTLNNGLKGKDYVEGMLCFKLNENVGDFDLITGKVRTGISSLDRIFDHYEVSILDKRVKYNADNLREGVPDLSRLYKIKFPKKYSPIQISKELGKLAEVEYAEPIPVNRLAEIPDDEDYGDMYHLPLIEAEAAWDIHKGENGPEVVIGIVDDAVDWRHRDLIDNQWENLGEDADGDGHVIEFNGTEWVFDPDDENNIDDDGNGKVDDFVGWDFINENDEQDNDPSPSHPGNDHGTHCIGIANSTTNNQVDVASIAWNVKYVTASIANDGDATLDYDGYEAMVYIAELGADILTNSWSGPYYSQANAEIIEYVQSLGAIVVASAGNDNNEELNYPASYPGVISVAATSQWDGKASFSSYGIAIDICAPGVNILSLKPNDLTQQMSGTSMSAPMTAGLLALLKSYYTGWTNEMIIIQAMATADDIDTINPYAANKLGYGRINALRALTETNASIQQELRLSFISYSSSDADTNGIYAPGEEINIGFEMINYAIGLDTTDVTFTLSSSSNDITIIDDEIVVDVPSDQVFSVDSAFIFEINPDLDSTKIISFMITASSDIAIPLDTAWEFQILVNQQGVLVYDGLGTGNSYSGEYIRDFLHSEGISLFYTEIVPPSFAGFDVLFLSFGNFGATLSNGTAFSQETSEDIADFIYSGGYVYIDCGSFFGLMEYSDFTNLEEIEGLFGVDTVITPLGSNPVELLSGQDGSLGDGMVFMESGQIPYFYIDIMIPDSNGMAMFEEDDYGIVAVQGEGEYGQKTVCMSYSLAHLVDDSTGNKQLLLARIAEFFGLLHVGTEEADMPETAMEINIYPNPASQYCNLDIQSITGEQIILTVYDNSGKQMIRMNEAMNDEQQIMKLDLSNWPVGIYYVVLQSGNNMISKKLIKR